MIYPRQHYQITIELKCGPSCSRWIGEVTGVYGYCGGDEEHGERRIVCERGLLCERLRRKEGAS